MTTTHPPLDSTIFLSAFAGIVGRYGPDHGETMLDRVLPVTMYSTCYSKQGLFSSLSITNALKATT